MTQRNVLVFGGSSGIGNAAATLLARQGAQVTITGRDPEKLATAARAIPGNVKTAVVDALDEGSVDAALEAAGLVDDVLICVSGGKGGGLFRELALEDLTEAFRAKTLAQLTIAQCAARRMKAGSITFVTAASPRSVIRGTAGLAAVNGALEQLIPILALELAPIRVNAISPGIIDTAWWDAMPVDVKNGFFATAEKTLPVGRVGRPDEVAELIATVMRTGFMTGSVYEIDGGSHLVTQ